MAGHASFDQRLVLIDEWPSFVDMTLEADGVLRGGGPQLPGQESAMGVVAIVTLQKTFVDAVVIGFGEIRFRRGVATVA